MLSEIIDQISDIISTQTQKTVRITAKHAFFLRINMHQIKYDTQATKQLN
jgi:hypothetical protein